MIAGTPALPQAAFTVAMLAQRWDTSTTFVYEEINRGRLRAFKLGAKLWRIRVEAVVEYEAAAELAAVPPTAEPIRAANDANSIGRMMRRSQPGR